MSEEFKKAVALEWKLDNPKTTLTAEMEEVAMNFIQEKLAEIDTPSKFGFKSVDFNDEDIFISYNNENQVFECFVGW